MRWVTYLLPMVFLFMGCNDEENTPPVAPPAEEQTSSPTATKAAPSITEAAPSNVSVPESKPVTPPPPPAETTASTDLDRTPDVVFVPTPQEVVDKMLELAQVTKDDIVYDLGCGDGRIVVTAAKKYGCKAFGFDIDKDRIEESLKNVQDNNVGDLVTIERRDIFTLDLSTANVVTLYLLPSLNVKLIPQLEKLKPGSRIVSHDFDMKGVTPDKVVEIRPDNGYREHTVYFWTTPLKKE